MLKAVSGSGSVNGRLPGGPGTDHYKALLKEQEDQVLALRKNLEEMQAFSSSSEKTVAELKVQVQQLKDQNALLKAQKGRSKDFVEKATEIQKSSIGRVSCWHNSGLGLKT